MGVNVHIESSKFYDDEMHPNPEKITDEDKALGRVKLGHDGKWRRKATFSMQPGADRGTTIVISDDQLKALKTHADLKGTGKSRNQAIAEHLATNVLPHCLHPSDIESLTVHGDAALEKFLNAYFEVK